MTNLQTGAAMLAELREQLLDGPLRELDPLTQEIFALRYDLYMPDVLRPLEKLYGERDDFVGHLRRLVKP